jgi:hypothetical protein
LSSTRSSYRGLSPPFDALHDEKALPRTDETEPPRLPLDEGVVVRPREALLQAGVLTVEPGELRLALSDALLRRPVAPQGMDVRESDDDERRNTEPA